MTSTRERFIIMKPEPRAFFPALFSNDSEYHVLAFKEKHTKGSVQVTPIILCGGAKLRYNSNTSMMPLHIAEQVGIMCPVCHDSMETE